MMRKALLDKKRQGKIIPTLFVVLCSFMPTEIFADALYGVNDQGLNNSQFFCIDDNGFHWLQPKFPGYDIEGLDNMGWPPYPKGQVLLASAGDEVAPPALPGMIYAGILLNNEYEEVPFVVDGNCNLGVPGAGVEVGLFLLGQGRADIGEGQLIVEVDGISERVVNGDAWGWGQDVGLFVFTRDPEPPYESIPAKVVVPMRGEIEDITWNIAGTKCYGVENMHGRYKHPFPYTQQPIVHPYRPDPQRNEFNASVNVAAGTWSARIWEYDFDTGNIQLICTDALAEGDIVEIEALETLPNDNLLLGFHRSPPLTAAGKANRLLIGSIDPESCQIVEIREIVDDKGKPVRNLDVEGLAFFSESE